MQLTRKKSAYLMSEKNRKANVKRGTENFCYKCDNFLKNGFNVLSVGSSIRKLYCIPCGYAIHLISTAEYKKLI